MMTRVTLMTRAIPSTPQTGVAKWKGLQSPLCVLLCVMKLRVGLFGHWRPTELWHVRFCYLISMLSPRSARFQAQVLEPLAHSAWTLAQPSQLKIHHRLLPPQAILVRERSHRFCKLELQAPRHVRAQLVDGTEVERQRVESVPLRDEVFQDRTCLAV
jgi:hypothetical protein